MEGLGEILDSSYFHFANFTRSFIAKINFSKQRKENAMFNIEELNVTLGNLGELMEDENVYAIMQTKYSHTSPYYRLRHIKECEIGKIISGDVKVVRFINVE